MRTGGKNKKYFKYLYTSSCYTENQYKEIFQETQFASKEMLKVRQSLKIIPVPYMYECEKLQ